MAVMSFAHLKTASKGEKQAMVQRAGLEKKRKEPPVDLENQAPEETTQKTERDLSFHESGSLEGVDLNAPIITEKFCYGYQNYSWHTQLFMA